MNSVFKTLSVFVFAVFFSTSIFAQKSESKSNSNKSEQPVDRGATYSTEVVKKKNKKKKSKNNYSNTFDQKVEEYEKRMESNAQAHIKAAKEMEKPQYSDPTYFGHKKKPKKRPPGKRKFCKECGMTH